MQARVYLVLLPLGALAWWYTVTGNSLFLLNLTNDPCCRLNTRFALLPSAPLRYWLRWPVSQTLSLGALFALKAAVAC